MFDSGRGGASTSALFNLALQYHKLKRMLIPAPKANDYFWLALLFSKSSFPSHDGQRQVAITSAMVSYARFHGTYSPWSS